MIEMPTGYTGWVKDPAAGYHAYFLVGTRMGIILQKRNETPVLSKVMLTGEVIDRYYENLQDAKFVVENHTLPDDYFENINPMAYR